MRIQDKFTFPTGPSNKITEAIHSFFFCYFFVFVFFFFFLLLFFPKRYKRDTKSDLIFNCNYYCLILFIHRKFEIESLLLLLHAFVKSKLFLEEDLKYRILFIKRVSLLIITRFIQFFKRGQIPKLDWLIDFSLHVTRNFTSRPILLRYQGLHFFVVKVSPLFREYCQCIENQSIGLMSRVFANGPRDRGSISGRVILKTQKWYLMPSWLTLSTIR